MATKKITELTALTALAAADELAIVDDTGPETKRISITNLFNSSGGIPVDIKLAAGKGINFSAYGAGASIGSNLLDDYEEGTWNPEYDFATGTATPGSSDAGAYRKIGSVVIVTFRVSTDGISSPTGAVDIINLPFAATGSNGGSVGVARNFSTDMPNIKARITGGQSKISIIKNATDAGFTSVQGSDFASGSDKNFIIGTLTYVTS